MHTPLRCYRSEQLEWDRELRWVLQLLSEPWHPYSISNLLVSNLTQNALHEFVIRNTELGDALAETFDEANEVVLMRGHGMALRAPSIRHAVFRAFYAKQSAVVQMQAAFLSPELTQRDG
uniref:Class II aldolase/adducin N-terminal domain-containing protein n=1 Tax=Moniliophthora roreri TaxID=221103 RepID=A0A0W0G1X3_MONRR